MRASSLFILLGITSGLYVKSTAQEGTMPKGALLLPVSYSVYASAGDFNNRYGGSSAISLDLQNKTQRNWTFGLRFGYHFGKEINETTLLSNLSNTNGTVTDQDGYPAEMQFFMRGISILGTFGGIINFRSSSPHSGIWISGGAGFLQHKIKIEDLNGKTTQVGDRYIAGYDRLTNGMALQQYLGYLYMDKNKLVNFHIGLDIIEGFTKNRRIFQYDIMEAETHSRIDILWGLRLGWILPFYRLNKDEYFTN